jgi:nicotinamidase-related amidase
MNKVIIVVDMQDDFVDGSLGTKEAQAMLPHLVQKLARAQKSHNVDLVFTMDTHNEDYLQSSEGKKLPVEHCIKGTQGWKIVPQLQAFKEVATAVVEKPTFGSIELPGLVANYDEIELVGLCTDICVISNALLLKAFYPEKKISVDPSCCAGVTPESHENALSAMKMCQIDIGD